MSGFAAKFLKQRGGGLRLVNAIEKGRECWFVIKVDPVKFLEYRSAMSHERIDLHDYGQILDCGWGNEPPQDKIYHWMKEAV
jgi:hypothetical protein